MPQQALKPRTIIWLAIVILLGATWVRLWQFPDIPPAFNYDESYNVLDALWLSQADSLWVFLPGNTGRHALYHYLAIPFLLLLESHKVFALRFVSVMISIPVIPLTYRWISTMFRGHKQHHLFGLMASIGIAFSFWHITLSRSGFRASLLLLLYVLMAYLFWQGWQKNSNRHIIRAGIVLGLCQYTYWLAGLIPFQIGLFAIMYTFWAKEKPYPASRVWFWIGLMAVTSFIVFLPLGWLYLTDPTVLQYVTQSRAGTQTGDSAQSWFTQIIIALRIFLDAPLDLWQGQFDRLLRFDWLALIGFWVGLIISVRRWRQPAYLFLITGLFVLWLPAPLNDIDFSDLRLLGMIPVHHAISNLRVIGVLPIYYSLVGVGLVTGGSWLRKSSPPLQISLLTLMIFFVVSISINSYSFFVIWPKQPFMYERYNGPIFDLAQQILQESNNQDILLPAHLYGHPTMRLFFDDIFVESNTPPASSNDTALLVTAETTPLTSYAWLHRSASGSGTVYLTPSINLSDLTRNISSQQSIVFAAPLHYTAKTYTIPSFSQHQAALAGNIPPNSTDYVWNNEIKLAGYEISPDISTAGTSVTLTLYWQNLVDQPIVQDVFIHLVNQWGEGVGQVDGVELSDGHRWRAGKLTPTHHILQLNESLAPGPYLMRLGLFNANSNTRLSVNRERGDILGDQVFLGVLYVIEAGLDEQTYLQPTQSIKANLGDQIELTGLTLNSSLNDLVGEAPHLSLDIFWRATAPNDINYTIFLQLLDEQNQVITSRDTQPINNNYPTTLWQRDQMIRETYDLLLSAPLSPGKYRLVTGMYDLQTGQRLPANNQEDIPLPDNMIELFMIDVTLEGISILPQP